MNRKSNITVVCILFALVTFSQSKWDKDVVVTYKMTDKTDKLLNFVKVTSDTLYYEWISKDKPVMRKFLMNDELASKINDAIKKNKVLKFKSAAYTKGYQNIVFTYTKKSKTKEVVFSQNTMANSREEKFIKEFTEPIVKKVFEQELKNDMRH